MHAEMTNNAQRCAGQRTGAVQGRSSGGCPMKDIEDWNFILNTVDALFYRLSNGACRADMILVDCHEELWTSFEQGHVKLKPGDDDSVGIEPCHSDDERRAAMEQNKLLADYRRHAIDRAVAAA